MGEIKRHYGEVYEEQLKPWARDIANSSNMDEATNWFAMKVWRPLRMNTVIHALSGNLNIILSPDTGMRNYLHMIPYWTLHKAEYVALAEQHSKELKHTYQNLDRDFKGALRQSIIPSTFGVIQTKAAEMLWRPVVAASTPFRTMTFAVEFKKAKERGLSDVEASNVADGFVRLHHGATSIVDLPAVMRQGEMMKTFTLFYSFQNAMYNWQRGIKGNLSRGEWNEAIKNTWGAVVLPSLIGFALFNKYQRDDSWWEIAAKTGGMQLMQTMPLARDIAGTMVEGRNAKTLLTSLIEAAGKLVQDVDKAISSKPIKKPFSDATNVIGPLTGLPLGQVGKTGQAMVDVESGKVKPKNLIDYARLIIQGKKSSTGKEWQWWDSASKWWGKDF
jgi:hypothetical protein